MTKSMWPLSSSDVTGVYGANNKFAIDFCREKYVLSPQVNLKYDSQMEVQKRIFCKTKFLKYASNAMIIVS